MLKNLAHFLKYRYLEFKWDRILKKSGYDTWEEYLYSNDPGYRMLGKTVGERFAGYGYLVRVDVHDQIRELLRSGNRASTIDLEEMISWCNENCSMNYRIEWIQTTRRYLNENNTIDSVRIATSGPISILVAAFEMQEDASFFTAYWG